MHDGKTVRVSIPLFSGLNYYKTRCQATRIDDVSIPLFSGLNYYTSSVTWSLLKRSSQSLYFQGWITTFFGKEVWYGWNCLNPFIFRAELLRYDVFLIWHTWFVSIPLFSGLNYYRLDVLISRRGWSQSLYFQGWITTPCLRLACSKAVCLNPFIFRAELLQKQDSRNNRKTCVSIPLFSGLNYYLSLLATMSALILSQSLYFQGWITTSWKIFYQAIVESQSLYFQGWITTRSVCSKIEDTVSIPLFSGLNYYAKFELCAPSRESQSLYFQGWITTVCKRKKGDIISVSIPLFSGLNYYQLVAEKATDRLSQSLYFQGWITTSRRARKLLKRACLNPFIFRAELLLYSACWIHSLTLRLNPFIFRAELLQYQGPRLPEGATSQSLYFQGWITTHRERQRGSEKQSQSLYFQGWITTVGLRKTLSHCCLNPFIFRAELLQSMNFK